MNYTGQKAILNSTSEEGIILQEINENNIGWKVQFSFENKNLIKRFDYNEITIVEKVKDELLLKQLIKNINSEDLDTQFWSSEILCYFVEEYGNDIEMAELAKAIESMINKLKVENEYNIEQKLAEGIFEFLWLEKIDKKEEEKLIITLAKLNKDCFYCYLNDDDYLSITEVKKFIERKQIEYNTSH
ncbi:hypothetical protein [Flavobacterium sp. HJJ]|uniref:hypothetical protein n=1 Tax=Flavobacterium sp. HJJ TaxID=2783792 RepID=UPI00188AD42D|nr:hypothetical protein [Flavobacterium sp. HJJ]MBF4473811.1 hypothetical protein [Flavobacterium sp. HJJ]